MNTLDGLEVLSFAVADQWESWLADHHHERDGVWLAIATCRGDKKPRSDRTVLGTGTVSSREKAGPGPSLVRVRASFSRMTTSPSRGGSRYSNSVGSAPELHTDVRRRTGRARL